MKILCYSLKHHHLPETVISMRLVLSIFLLVFTIETVAQEVEMVTSFETAKERADKERKDILIILTGSEWCKPCKKMDKEVITHPLFQKYVKENLIVYLVDLPTHLVINSDVYKNYENLKSRYGTSALPSLILTDKSGNKIRLLEGKIFRLDNVMGQLQAKKE